MKTWNHITETQRKVILSGVCHRLTAKQIAESLDKHPTTISKELKKKAVLKSKVNNPKTCPNLLSYPFVCNGCSKKYTNCGYSKYEYNPKTAEIHNCVKKRHSKNHVSLSTNH